ncbi:hypothetical protein AB0F15_04815 [Amycolatopsis sp. NPDC026612]|uniref:hypothetical protein n=1 Tax=Amycolatopsis sp. NPDC026612 TaxID=3155466 RepID=UPI0033F87AB3
MTTGWTVVVIDEIGALSRWRLSGSTWRATVTVEPRRWRDGQREFAEEIESDIIEFLDNLRKGVMLRGNDGSKFVLVFSLSGAHEGPATSGGWPFVDCPVSAWSAGYSGQLRCGLPQ